MLISILFFNNITGFSQTIGYSFENAENTNDGSNDFYEADIVLTTDTDFSLGAGQFYLDYNTAAFGENVVGNTLIYNHPFGSATGYVLDEKIFGGFADGYRIVNANSTTSKLSLSWSTNFQGAVTTNITAGAPVPICHIKIQYVDASESPNIIFDVIGPIDSYGLTFTDDRLQLTDDSYDSSGAIIGGVLSTEHLNLTGFSIYPNPAVDFLHIQSVDNIDSVTITTLTGDTVLSIVEPFVKKIDIRDLLPGMYLVKVTSNGKSAINKIIKR